MTNTPPEQLKELAELVYPDYTVNVVLSKVIIASLGFRPITYDPETNKEQSFDLFEWMLTKENSRHVMQEVWMFIAHGHTLKQAILSAAFQLMEVIKGE